MFKFFFKIFVILFFLSSSSESVNLDNILINGNKRISNETILVFSEISEQQPLDQNSINTILKKLYKTGFFKDVVIKFENEKLIINVVENPIIQTVFINGIKRKKTEESISEILLLKDRSSFNIDLVKKDEILISNYLKDKGFYFSTVNSSIKDLGDNKIDLFYEIELGDKAKISKISFIGEKVFKTNTLKNVIVSEEYKFWKFISGKKFLNEKLINYDKRLLGNFYKNKGYYEVNIESSFANYLGNSEFEIIYNISPGKKYFFNELNLKLPIDYERSNFEQLTSLFEELKGEKYSLNAIDKILNIIDKIALNKQFEFLNSTVKEETNENLINLTFEIEETEKFYIERINIFGNNITREEVVRNNFLLDEGDGFNELLQTKTINNIKSLGFFSTVSSEVTSGSSDYQKIININVEERPTGEISAGAGFGTSGATLAFGVSENNFLGRGIEFASDLTLSTDTVKGTLSLNDPNYKGTNKSLNFTLESTATDRLANYGYESKKIGLTIGSGFELYDDIFFKAGFSTYSEKLTADSTATANIKKQDGSYFDAIAHYSFTYDQRNQRYKTTDGYISRFSQAIPVVSSTDTLINQYDYKIYNEWLNENIATFAFYAKSADSLSGKYVKLSERLFMPSKKLRGFENGRVGPKDGADYIGGNYLMSVNVATTLPQILPNLQNTDFSLFFDAANIWGVDFTANNLGGSKIRTVIGVAVDFSTAIGPLNFSLSQPLTKTKNDITESFRFNLGTTF